jgi:hypothetical protein
VLLDLLQPFGQPRPLPADVDEGRGLEPLAELALGGVDDLLGQGGRPDQGQDLGLNSVGRAAPGLAAEGRAAVVADLAPLPLEVSLAAEAGPA